MAISLIDQLKTIEYTPNIRWYQFIQDHKHTILFNSRIQRIDVNEMNTFRYKPFEFLSKLNIPYSMMWITCYINDIIDPVLFINKTFILIPDKSYIHGLRTTYNTYISKL